MGFIGRRVARGSFIIFSRDVLANVIALAGSIIVARLLGPDEYGLSSIALIYPGMAISIAGLGISQAIMRFSSATSIKSRSSEYIYSGLMASSISAAVASLTILILSSRLADLLGRPALASGISLLSIYVFSAVIYSSVESSLLGLGRYEDTAIATIARAVVRVSIAIPLALLSFGYIAVLWGLSLGYFIGSFIGFAMILRRSHPTKPQLDRAGELLKYSLPLYLPTIISSPINQVIMGFLALKASDFEMGNLSVANLLVTPLGMVGNALNAAVFSSIPLLIEDNEKLSNAINKSILYTNIIIIPAALGLAMLSKPITLILYGSSYSATPKYLFLILIPYVFNALASGAMTLYANTVGDTVFTGVVALVDTVIRAPVAFEMINLLGILGYLLTSIVVNPITAVITLLLGRKRYGLMLWYKKNLMVALWGITPFTSALILSYFTSEYVGIAIYFVVLILAAKYFISKGEAVEIVELFRDIPIIGHLLQVIGEAVVRKFW